MHVLLESGRESTLVCLTAKGYMCSDKITTMSKKLRRGIYLEQNALHSLRYGVICKKYMILENGNPQITKNWTWLVISDV
jgi:hypothetical protein